MVVDFLHSNEEALSFGTSPVCCKKEMALKEAGVQKQRERRDGRRRSRSCGKMGEDGAGAGLTTVRYEEASVNLGYAGVRMHQSAGAEGQGVM